MEIALEPKSPADAALLHAALSSAAAEDPHLNLSRDAETGWILVGGVSELQLEAAIARLRAGENGDFAVGALQVSYREQLGRAVQIRYVYKRLLGPRGEFAIVVIDFAPAEAGAGFVFENKANGAVPDEFVPGIEKGLNVARDNGLIAGFPLIDFRATLVNGAHHDVDSSVLAFQIAAKGAFRELKEKGDVKLVEPIMKVEVVAPDECLGSVISDLIARRGMIQERTARGDAVIISATAPLANLFGYVNTLSLISEGRATSTMQFDRYHPVPLAQGDPPFPPAVGMRA